MRRPLIIAAAAVAIVATSTLLLPSFGGSAGSPNGERARKVIRSRSPSAQRAEPAQRHSPNVERIAVHTPEREPASQDDANPVEGNEDPLREIEFRLARAFKEKYPDPGQHASFLAAHMARNYDAWGASRFDIEGSIEDSIKTGSLPSNARTNEIVNLECKIRSAKRRRYVSLMQSYGVAMQQGYYREVNRSEWNAKSRAAAVNDLARQQGMNPIRPDRVAQLIGPGKDPSTVRVTVITESAFPSPFLGRVEIAELEAQRHKLLEQWRSQRELSRSRK